MEIFKSEKESIELAEKVLENLKDQAGNLLSAIAFQSMIPQCAKYINNNKQNEIIDKKYKINNFDTFFKASIFIAIIIFKVLFSHLLSSSINKNKFDIAFYYHVKNHWKVLEPIHDYLQDKKDVIIVSLLSFKKHKTHNAVFSVYIEKFCGYKIFNYIINIYTFLFNIKRLNFNMINPLLTERQFINIIFGAASAEYYHLCTGQFLKRYRIRNHIFGDDGGQNLRSIVLSINNSYCGKTYLVQHGIVADPIMYFSACNTIFSWGNDSSNRFKSLNIKKDKIKTVGCPRIDKALTSKANVFFDECNYIKKIAIFTSPLEKYKMTFKNIIESIVEKNKNFEIFIKLHPADNRKHYIKYKKYLLSQEMDSLEILSQINICLITESTVGIEAMAMNVITIAIDSSVPNISSIYLNSEHIEDIIDLDCNKILSNQRMILKNILLLDGNSIQRITKYLT